MELSQEEKEKNLWNLVLAEYKNGNIVVSGIDGFQRMPLDDFLKQPVDGILYDLNRLEEVVGTFISDPKWVNDFAVAKTIRELHRQLTEARNERQWLKTALEKKLKAA